MRRNRVVVAIALLIMVVLVFAWVDGGREPLRMIEQPVALPERAQ